MSARDAAGVSVEEILAAPQPPKRIPCHACGHQYAGCACPICKTERKDYAALKAQEGDHFTSATLESRRTA